MENFKSQLPKETKEIMLHTLKNIGFSESSNPYRTLVMLVELTFMEGVMQGTKETLGELSKAFPDNKGLQILSKVALELIKDTKGKQVGLTEKVLDELK